MEVDEICDVTNDSNTLAKIQNIHQKGYKMEKTTFNELKKTVQDIVEILTVVEEDILKTVMVTEGLFEPASAVKADTLQTVKTDKNISNLFARSEKETIKNSDKMENCFLFQNDICLKLKKESILDNVFESKTVKETNNAVLTDNALPKTKDLRYLKEIIDFLTSKDSNEIPLKENVDKKKIHKLINKYIAYRRNRNNNLSKLYDSTIIMDNYLDETSFIAQQCRIAITETHPEPDVNLMLEKELKTINSSLVKKVTDYKECLRSLCWSLDGVLKKILLYKKLNCTIDKMTDEFLNSDFSNREKKD